MKSNEESILKYIGIFRIIGVGAILLLFLSGAASAIPYTVGDVFVSGNNLINEYTPTGNLVQTLNSINGQTGMCFNASGYLYATTFQFGKMELLDNNGNMLTYPWGGPFAQYPESCVADNAGNVYTGEVPGPWIRKFDPSGTLLTYFTPAIDLSGSDWIDLSADQKTMFYTSENSSIKRFDISNNAQLPDFTSGLNAPCFALRIRPNTNGEVMVSCSNMIYRLDNTGTIIQTYPESGLTSPTGVVDTDYLFAMNLDPDGKTFWTAVYNSGNVYRIDISSGAQVTSFHTTTHNIGGLAIFGEMTAITHRSGSIAGKKFNDINANHIFDIGESGIANWTITLTNDTGVTITQSTAGDGSYNFTNLTDSNYTVGEVMQSGWIQTAPLNPSTITLQISQQNNITDFKNNDFGNHKLGEIKGEKFEDLNANGIKDPDEVGLAGWNITITGKDTSTNVYVNQTVTTDANGSYQFSGLNTGTYTISETLKDGWVQTAPKEGTYTATITTSSSDINKQDFGNFHKGKITGGGYISVNGDPKATFGIVGQYPGGNSDAQGNVEYQDHTAGINIKSTEIDSVATTLDDKKGVITGKTMINKDGPYPFTVYVEDNGEPGKGVDIFNISMASPIPYTNGAILNSGNIQIHK